MIIYNAEISKDIIKKMIENERTELSNNQKIFDFHKNLLLLYAQKIVEDLKQIEMATNSQQLLNIFATFKDFFQKLHFIEDILKKLSQKVNDFSNAEEIQEIEINEYNNTISILQNSWNNFLAELEAFAKDLLNNASSDFTVESTPIAEEQQPLEEVIVVDNDCLLISEKQNKVFLPYKVRDLEKKLAKSNTKYSNVNELIQKEYILPLNRFQNPILSRFRESFNLMRLKENSSIIEALDIALELSLNSTLNPAVIAACKNKDELDIYLDCLYEKELEQFKLFDIKYEINPQIK